MTSHSRNSAGERAGAETAGLPWRRALPPLRMMLAAVLAYALSTAAHFPEGYWAVLSAVIVTRPLPGAALQAGADRLAGTLLGAGLGCAVSFGRLWHLPDILLLASTLLPLAVFIAWRPGWRTAPIAAVIVLSASPLGHGPLGAAVYRIAEIGLGAVTGVATSWFLLPARSDRAALELGRTAQSLLLAALEAAHASDAKRCKALQAGARQHLRSLAGLVRTAPWERTDKALLDRLQSAAGRLSLSVGFAARTLLAAHHGANPVLANRALQERIAALLTSAPTASHPHFWADREQGGATPLAPQHREQAQAIGYALGMVLHDAKELSSALSAK
jgi:uncharacterized membrane protein YccC